MDLGGKMEGEVEIKCDTDELFQICSGKKTHTIPNLSPDKVSKVDLHEGEWGDHGSIKVWTYVTGTSFLELTTIGEEEKPLCLFETNK
ncbi:MLP-like protein 43 [Camellia lanceoleosa]|nr:MLP-like protein 43 [Camellia lanceoleosa]